MGAQETQFMQRAKVYRGGKNSDEIACWRESNSKLNITQESSMKIFNVTKRISNSSNILLIQKYPNNPDAPVINILFLLFKKLIYLKKRKYNFKSYH